MVKISCVQLNSNNDVEYNINEAIKYIEESVFLDSKMVFLPENTTLMSDSRKGLLANSSYYEDSKEVAQLCEAAKRNKIWVFIGSIAFKQAESEKLINRSVIINDKGEVADIYDKIHLFDANPKPKEFYRESNNYDKGNKAVITETPYAKIGNTICYDLRFPYFYRYLAQHGAEIITVPSAFTKTTGEAHWEVLLRARAIETGCFIVASNQCGVHPAGRETYGNSMIINPWGEVIARADDATTGIITADINLDEVYDARRRLGSLDKDHKEMFL